MENRIKIPARGREPIPLPMSGCDADGNRYEADNISLIKNGRRFIPVMGEFHFSRYEPEDWEEELLKMRAGGITVAATYVFWIHHEEREGEWDFTGCRNLKAFLQICRKIHMSVWLRVGPWAHGECRNGGFPDWVAQSKNFKVRCNDPGYLEKVRSWYQKLGEQAEGQMCKDGGPIIGLQLENEYGHCGGPSDREEGMAHLRMLKKLAQEAGFVVPYYTATGWGGGYVVDYEMLPVLGGYVDAPWAEHVEQMPASANFVFSAYKQDENIGSDLKRGPSRDFTFDIHSNPYLTAELGGGLQVTAHRRTHPYPADIEAQSLCMLGGGANLLGYYMYHGGINPDGKYSTLQESRATGYINDLPVKSYDFQTCIRQSGEVNASFGRLKKLHLMLGSFGEELAEAQACFPELLPESPEDMDTLRVTARVNRENGSGFLFLNNHQRNRVMKAHRDFAVRLEYEGEKESLTLSGLNLESGECAVIPFGLRLGGRILERTNASLLCRLGNRIFFYTDQKEPEFVWRQEGGLTGDDVKEIEVVTLTTDEANRAFLTGEKLIIAEHGESCLIEKDGELYLLTRADQETLTVYEETGKPEKVTVRANPERIAAEAQMVKEVYAEDGSAEYREYQVQVGAVNAEYIHQLYLELDYAGDRAEVYQDGKLVDDWFTTGEKWHLALKRFGYPSSLLIRIYASDKPIPNPYGNKVYYDLPVEPGCEIKQVKALPEYRIPLAK